jgi:hypothetical protein
LGLRTVVELTLANDGVDAGFEGQRGVFLMHQLGSGMHDEEALAVRKLEELGRLTDDGVRVTGHLTEREDHTAASDHATGRAGNRGNALEKHITLTILYSHGSLLDGNAPLVHGTCLSAPPGARNYRAIGMRFAFGARDGAGGKGARRRQPGRGPGLLRRKGMPVGPSLLLSFLCIPRAAGPFNSGIHFVVQ